MQWSTPGFFAELDERQTAAGYEVGSGRRDWRGEAIMRVETDRDVAVLDQHERDHKRKRSEKGWKNWMTQESADLGSFFLCHHVALRVGGGGGFEAVKVVGVVVIQPFFE